ncbi:MAG: hypothetical protein IJM90_03680 [Firmicutes bacterium]|nr:hypothetical protein [Bacillota bacterium]
MEKMILSERICYVEAELEKLPQWTVSRKCIRGKTRIYTQERDADGRRRDRYVKREGVESVLMQHERKQDLKALRRQYKAELKGFSRKERRDVREQIRIWPLLGSGRFQCSRNLFFDGTPRDSKSEIILSFLYEMLNIPYRVAPQIEITPVNFRYADLLAYPGQRDVYHEHMGMLGDPEYLRQQSVKLADYASVNIVLGKNLLVTWDQPSPDGKAGFINVQEVLWQMIRFGLVTARAVHKTFFRKKTPRANPWGQLRSVGLT